MYKRLKRRGIVRDGCALGTLVACAAAGLSGPAALADEPEWSIARHWNEQLLEGIRNDLARPPVHARNLYHVSAAMWDAWAAYDPTAQGVFLDHQVPLENVEDVEAARHEAISYAAYRMIRHRFQHSPGGEITLQAIDDFMDQLGYDINVTSPVGNAPANVGNACAMQIIVRGFFDGSNEGLNFADPTYQPMNEALVVLDAGNPNQFFPNNWQEIWLNLQIDQLGNVLSGNTVPFIGPHWGFVTPFALAEEHKTPGLAGVYLDPGPPPMLGASAAETQEWIRTFAYVGWTNTVLSPDYDGSAPPWPWDGTYSSVQAGETMPEFINISPATWGNNPLGETAQPGHGPLNPVTGEPYAENWVKYGDYARVIAEFWADGPQSSTPPGHWNEIANQFLLDNPDFERRMGGTGPELDPLEWDVKMYLAINGAAHDAAVACWGVKGYYDWTRPILAIRYMADRGQSSDPNLPSYHPHGLPLIDGVFELITEESVQPGGKFEHLAEMLVDEDGDPLFDPKTFEILYDAEQFVGEVAVLAWPGAKAVDQFGNLDPLAFAPVSFQNTWVHPDYWIDTPYSGVMWVRAKRWSTYQSPTFITPPFAGYTSGHTTFSRAIAEVLTALTGSHYFPGGLAEYPIPAGWLEFEEGPSEDVVLQWATYFDCSDQSARSRIYGSIHPPVDDTPARFHGHQIGQIVAAKAFEYFGDVIEPCIGDVTGSGEVGVDDLLVLLAAWGDCPRVGQCPADLTGDGTIGVDDLLVLLSSWGVCQ